MTKPFCYHNPVIAYFSPTGTSRKVAQAIARGLKTAKTTEIDVTKAPLTSKETLSSEHVLIIAVPVYGNACAPIALQRLDMLYGNNTPAIAVVVYGNRDFGNAANELFDFLTQRGFCVIGAAAFVGEHSYSTPQAPIAEGRPGSNDLREAEHFGHKLGVKMQHTITPIDITALKRPSGNLLGKLRFMAFVLRYRSAQKKHPVKVLPITNADLCHRCGLCVNACPIAAIPAKCPTKTYDHCIKCAACVKACPQRARTLPTPFAPVLAKNFKKQKPNITIC